MNTIEEKGSFMEQDRGRAEQAEIMRSYDKCNFLFVHCSDNNWPDGIMPVVQMNQIRVENANCFFYFSRSAYIPDRKKKLQRAFPTGFIMKDQCLHLRGFAHQF